MGTLVLINNSVFYFVVALVDGAIFLWVINTVKSLLEKHINESKLFIVEAALSNIINVIILYFIYGTYKLFVEGLPAGVQGGLDPKIPLIVKDTVHHSSHLFEMLLRIDMCLDMTLASIAYSVDHVAFTFYQFLRIITMSFWPFLGTTIIYRFFLSRQGFALNKGNNDDE